MAQTSYLRFPHLVGDLLTFVAEDDVWLAELPGGGAGAGSGSGSGSGSSPGSGSGIGRAGSGRPVRATRFTSDWQPVRNPRLSPDGAHLAWARRRDGAPEVHVAPVEGGDAKRLTYWADDRTDVLDWLSPREVIVAGGRLPMRGDVRAHAVPVEGGVPLVLPYGTVHGLAVHGPGGAVMTRRGIAHDASWWKRYRGGRAGQLWVDADGSGDFRRILRNHEGNIDRPLWVGGRAAFLSDATGVSELYSCLPDGSDLRRHTDEPDGFYARHASSDGTRVVFMRGGRLWLLEDLDGEARPLDVRLVGTRIGRTEFPASAGKNLGGFAADRTGRAAAVEVRGTLHWLTAKDGPARALAVTPGVRARMPVVLGETGYAAWVTDAGGEWSLEIGPVDGHADLDREYAGGAVVDDAVAAAAVGAVGAVGDSAGAGTGAGAEAGSGDAAEPGADADGSVSLIRRILTGEVTRVADLAASPDGAYLAVSTEDNRLLLVDVETGTARCVVSGPHYAWGTLAEDPVFSPDSKWLAWAEGTEVDGPRKIRIADVATTTPIDITDGRFLDWSPAFTLDGRHLAFLSNRTFDPYYADEVFDLYFMPGARPYLVPLSADEPSPFAPMLKGRPIGGAEEHKSGAADSGDADHPDHDGHGARHPAESRVDAEGIGGRIVPFPVPAGNYSALAAAKGGVLWLESYRHGALGDSMADSSHENEKPRLRRYDFAKREALTLADEAHAFSVSGDGARVLVRDGGSLRLQPSDARPDNGDREPLDLDRIRVTVDPVAERRQGLQEAWLLQRDCFWRDDLGGVDWPAVRDKYAPLAEAVATQDDFVDLLWEMQGELGTSHAYAYEDAYGGDPARRHGRLGADLERDAEGQWRIARILPGDASVPHARSPFEAPGVGARVGDVLIAIDGRPVDADLGPGPLLAGKAGKPTEVVLWRDAEVGADAVAELAASSTAGVTTGVIAGVATDATADVASGATAGVATDAPADVAAGASADVATDAMPGPTTASTTASSAGSTTPDISAIPAQGTLRRVVIVPLDDERLLRYQAWVADRRAHVHARSGGRLGYVHLPDQAARGWAAFHRDLATQTAREGLICDTRDNRGGNTSALVVEQLMRRVAGWKLVRGKVPRTYPPQAVRGPLVAVCDEYSASDGDMINQHLKDLGVPVVGVRTWGGVVGVDSRFRLLDGVHVMQPKFMNWFTSVGYGLENHGCEPTVEVEYTPADANAGRDPQLDAAIDLALAELAEHPAATPPVREWLE